MRSMLRLWLAGLALVLAAASASSQQFPNKPIRLIVPYPAGGATDVVARLIAERMSEDLGQQIVVENRPGAGTMIGASAVARSPADGYTLLMGDTGTYALNPTLYGTQLTYDPAKDFSAGVSHRARAADPHGEPEDGQRRQREGADRRGQEGAGQDRLRSAGSGQPDPSCDGAVQAAGRHPGDAPSPTRAARTRSTTCSAAASASCSSMQRPA